MIFSPDGKPLFKVTGEGNEQELAALLEQGLSKCADELDAQTSASDDWSEYLSAHALPFNLEKTKHVTKQQATLAS